MTSSFARKYLFPPAIIGLVTFFASTLGVLSRHAGHLAALWPTNVIQLWMFLFFPIFRTLPCLITAILAEIFVEIIIHDPIIKIFGLTFANFSGVLTAYVLFRKSGFPQKNMNHPTLILRLLLICSLSSAIAAVFGSAIIMPTSAHRFYTSFSLWFTSELNRYLILFPIGIAFYNLNNNDKIKYSSINIFKNSLPKLCPIISLLLSSYLAIYIPSPGFIIAPIPALMWCALSYSWFSMSLILFLFNESAIAIWNLQFVTMLHLKSSICAESSFRFGLTLLLLGPQMLSVVMNNQKNLIARLNKMAMHDSLTNTLTRRAYIERTEALINGALPDNFQGMSVLMVDLDKFKDINDRYGHLAGDMALVVVSETLMKHLPHNALVGRLGGEEFAVTLFNLSLDATIQLSDMLCRKVSELEIKPKDGIKLQVTISIGVSHQHHVGHDSLQSLLHDADSALYEAKKQGRNRSLHIAEFPSQQGNDHSGTLYQGGSCLP